MHTPIYCLLFLTLAGCNQSAADRPPSPADQSLPGPPADLAKGDPGNDRDLRPADVADGGGSGVLPSDPPQVVFSGLSSSMRASAVALNRADRAELVFSTDSSVEILRETPGAWQKTAIETGIQPTRGVHITLKDDQPWLSYVALTAGSYTLKVAHAEIASFVGESVAIGLRAPGDAGAPIALNRAGEPVVFYRSGDYAVFSRRGAMAWESGGIFLQDGYPHSLRRGPSGRLQLAYQASSTFVSGPRLGEEVDGNTWVITAPAPGNPSGTMDLAIGAADIAHIAEFENTTGQVRYASNARRSHNWPTDALEQTQAADVRIGIARGPRGEEMPVVAYQKLPEADVRIARRIDGFWQIETVDTAGEVGQALSLAIDSHGRAHIFYVDATAHTLKRVIR